MHRQRGFGKGTPENIPLTIPEISHYWNTRGITGKKQKTLKNKKTLQAHT